MRPFLSRRVTVFIFLFGCLPASAFGQEFNSIMPARAFEFDAPDGQYMTWSGSVSCSINAIRGVVHFSRYGQRTTQWHPGVTIFVRRDDGNAERSVRLAFHAMQYQPPFQADLDSWVASLHRRAHSSFVGRPGADSSFSFLMSWNSDGEVTARVGDELHKLRIGVQPDRVELNGTTGAGRVIFELGHISQGKHDECKLIV